MTKRLTSVVLVLIFAFSLLTGNAFANENDETEATAYSLDFEFAKAIGIFTEDYSPSDPLTRIELARCIVNIITNGIIPAKDSQSMLFDDVSYEDAGYADAVAQAGIMNGVGNRMFAPDAEVTYTQLLKVFVSFLGYDVKAQALGGYPAGYTMVASSLKITDENVPFADSYVTYGALATMFKKALGVPLFQIVSYSGNGFEYKECDDTDYMSQYLHILRYTDVVNGVYNSNIINNEKIQHDEIILGSTLFRFDPDKMNLGEKLGYKMDVFYTIENGYPQIIYYDEYENNVVVIDGREVVEYDDGIIYFEGNKEKIIKMNIETNVLYNGSLCDSYDKELFNVWHTSATDGTIKAIDNDDDGKFEFVMLDAYNSYVVDTITADAIVPMYRNGVVIDISFYNEGEDILFRNLKGKPVSIDNVVKGSVISVSSNLDGVVTNIVVTSDTYTGVVDEIEVENEKRYIIIGGKKYTPSACLPFNPQISRLRPGDRVTMMFNKDGLLSDVETLRYQQVDTGYLIDAKTGSGLESSDNASIRLFSSGGFFSIYDLAKKVEVLYGEEILYLKPVEVLQLFGYLENGKIKRQLFMYKKNKDGQINWMNILKEDSGPVDGFYKYNLSEIGLSSSPKLVGTSFEGKLLINSTAIFYVPNEENRDDDAFYKAKTSLASNNSGYANIEIYGSKKESRIASAIVLPSTSKSSGETQNTMIVESVTQALDAEGVPSIKLKGFVSGAIKEYYGSKESFADENGKTAAPGDVVGVKADRENRIIEYDILFDQSEKKLAGSSNPTTARMDEQYRYLYGRLDWSDEESFLIEIDDGSGNLTKDVYLKSSTYKYYICEEGTRDGIFVRTGKVDEVFAYPEGFTQENNVFMWTNYGTPQIVVIYK